MIRAASDDMDLDAPTMFQSTNQVNVIDLSSFESNLSFNSVIHQLNHQISLNNYDVGKIILDLACFWDSKNLTSKHFQHLLSCLHACRTTLKEIIIKADSKKYSDQDYSDKESKPHHESFPLFLPLIKNISEFPHLEKIVVDTPSSIGLMAGSDRPGSKMWEIVRNDHPREENEMDPGLVIQMMKGLRLFVGTGLVSLHSAELERNAISSPSVQRDFLEELSLSRDTLQSINIQQISELLGLDCWNFMLQCSSNLKSLSIPLRSQNQIVGQKATLIPLVFPPNLTNRLDLVELAIATEGYSIPWDDLVKWIGAGHHLEKLELFVPDLRNKPGSIISSLAAAQLLFNGKNSIKTLSLDGVGVRGERTPIVKGGVCFPNLETFLLDPKTTCLFKFFFDMKCPKLVDVVVKFDFHLDYEHADEAFGLFLNICQNHSSTLESLFFEYNAAYDPILPEPGQVPIITFPKVKKFWFGWIGRKIALIGFLNFIIQF